MNIFFLHENPRTAARFLCNAHVRSQLKESMEILSTVQHRYECSVPDMAEPTHQHHPSVRWAGDSAHNYDWLHRHATEICAEYKLRHGVPHWFQPVIEALKVIPKGMPSIGFTTPPAVVSRDLKPDPDLGDLINLSDVVSAYRTYYNRDKRHLHYWMAPRDRPSFIDAPAPKKAP